MKSAILVALLALAVGCRDRHAQGFSSGPGFGNGGGTVTAATGGGLQKTGAAIGMLTSCAANQVLAWDGVSAWACASAGAGTVTGTTANGGLVATGTTLGMLKTCSNTQVLSYNSGTTTWGCSTPTTGTVTSVTAGTSLTGGAITGSGTINVSLPGGTCGPGQVVTAISAAGTATCGTVIANDYGNTHLEFVDEWLFDGTCGSSNPCGSIYLLEVSGTGTAMANVTAAGTRPGVSSLSTGSTTTGKASWRSSPSAFDFSQYTDLISEITVGFPALSAGGDEFTFYTGFGDTNTAIDQVDGCGFIYDRGNVMAAPTTGAGNSGNASKWMCYCSANSVRTAYVMDGAITSDESFVTVNAPIAALTLPNTNIYTLKVVVTAATRAEFYYNGVKSCDINTHVPTGSTRVTGVQHMILKSAGTTPTLVDVDRTRVAIDMTGARSP